VALRVEVVAPDGEVWSGSARMVIAKTLDGDLGILSGHPSVLGLLAEGSVVRILDPFEGESETVVAAVSSGFLSVADDNVSILAREAQLGSQVDVPSVRSRVASLEAEHQTPGEPEPAELRYSRALLRAAGDRS
jgi:F-type H+-transporting ATPase subunit epsilon